jgi:hypothetical protein
MSVKKGKRLVRISSPLSLLAIGMVFTCGGIAAIFLGNFFPDDLINDEFRKLFLGAGIYMLVAGVPAMLFFMQNVLSAPSDFEDSCGKSIEEIYGWVIGISLIIGLPAMGIFLLNNGKENLVPGFLLIGMGVFFLLLAIPIIMILKKDKQKKLLKESQKSAKSKKKLL